jgi:cytidylate kinase
MTVITISRQYGSGGRKTAERLAELLGYPLFDKRFMTQIASNVGMSDTEVVDYSEESYNPKSFIKQIRSLLGQHDIVAEVSTRERGVDGSEVQTRRSLDEMQAMDMLKAAVRAAYEKDNVVIVGRGAQVILRDMEDAFHVRVIAPMQHRMNRLELYEHLSYNDAWTLAQERDKANLEYMQRLFNENPDNPLLYDMVINTAKFTVDAAAQVIADTMKKSKKVKV